MARALRSIPFAGSLAEQLAFEVRPGCRIYWLGQAGFIIEMAGYRIIIDPYLSNSLAEKYKDGPRSYERMMPAPIMIDSLDRIDLVLCTHHHTDHMDSATLAPLARRFPDLKFVVPAASHFLAREKIGVDDHRLFLMVAGQSITPLEGLTLHAVRASHETLETDAQGQHRFLGYILESKDCSLFHSGDTIPFEGQSAEIAAFKPDLALLPVNGRSKTLLETGVPGNLFLAEALKLCEEAGIPAMMAHHFGMFAFNTLSADMIESAITPIQLVRAEIQKEYEV